MIQIVEENCPKNHTCPTIQFCPVDAIIQKNIYSAPRIDHEKWFDCGQCTVSCSRVFKHT